MDLDRRMPLEGIRVIELGVWIQGPLAGQILADLGATVIKVERPAVGDPSRRFGHPLWRADALGGRALLWELCNRNKRSMVIDLTLPKGRELVHRLVSGADVFLSNLQREVLERFGAGRETLCELNPSLIYANGGGLSLNGPHSSSPAQDTVGMAHSGFMSTVGSSTGGPSYPLAPSPTCSPTQASPSALSLHFWDVSVAAQWVTGGGRCSCAFVS